MPPGSDSLKPGGDIDAFAIEIAAFDHDVAQIDPDTQDDAPLRRQRSIRRIHLLLQVKSALHRVDCAGELNQHTVARDLKDPAPVASNQRLQHFFAAELKRSERSGFVALHEAAIADYVRSENGGQATSRGLFRHSAVPQCCLVADCRSALVGVYGLRVSFGSRTPIGAWSVGSPLITEKQASGAAAKHQKGHGRQPM